MSPEKSGERKAEYGGSVPSVLLVVSGKRLASQLDGRLREAIGCEVDIAESISFEKRAGAARCHGSDGTGIGYDAVIAGLSASGGSLSERFSDARRKGYRGLLVAVLRKGEEGEAAGLIGAGADYILSMPARKIDFDIIGERLHNTPHSGGSSWKVLRDLLKPVEQGVVLLDGARRLIFANDSARATFSAMDDDGICGVIEANCTGSVFEKSRLEGSAVTYADIALPGLSVHKLLGMEVLYLDDPCGEQFYLVLIHDFSRWKKLDELRSKFATSLSHRLRTPLTSVRNAVRLLGECDECTESSEKERLLEIGWRNVEKMITNLDELQKIFLIESEELNVCRTMVSLLDEMQTILDESAEEEKIRGFKLSAADMMIFTGKGRLRDFFTSAVDAYDLWLSEKPFIECSTSVREVCDSFGKTRKKLVIYLRPRTMSRLRSSREGLREFLSLNEAHRGLVLGRLASALDAELQISPGNTISLTLPLDPDFSREKDLVHPLHMMVERSDIMGSPFTLVSLSIQGKSSDQSAPREVLQKVLSRYAGADLMVALGEETGSWSLFINGRKPEEIEELMSDIRKDFLRSCRESNLSIYPSLDWDARYDRSPGTSDSAIDRLLVSEMA